MANKHVKMFSTLLIISKMQIKITVRNYYIPTRMAKIKKSNNTKCWWQHKEIGTLIYW